MNSPIFAPSTNMRIAGTHAVGDTSWNRSRLQEQNDAWRTMPKLCIVDREAKEFFKSCFRTARRRLPSATLFKAHLSHTHFLPAHRGLRPDGPPAVWSHGSGCTQTDVQAVITGVLGRPWGHGSASREPVAVWLRADRYRRREHSQRPPAAVKRSHQCRHGAATTSYLHPVPQTWRHFLQQINIQPFGSYSGANTRVADGRTTPLSVLRVEAMRQVVNEKKSALELTTGGCEVSSAGDKLHVLRSLSSTGNGRRRLVEGQLIWEGIGEHAGPPPLNYLHTDWLARNYPSCARREATWGREIDNDRFSWPLNGRGASGSRVGGNTTVLKLTWDECVEEGWECSTCKKPVAQPHQRTREQTSGAPITVAVIDRPPQAPGETNGTKSSSLTNPASSCSTTIVARVSSDIVLYAWSSPALCIVLLAQHLRVTVWVPPDPSPVLVYSTSLGFPIPMENAMTIANNWNILVTPANQSEKGAEVLVLQACEAGRSHEVKENIWAQLTPRLEVQKHPGKDVAKKYHIPQAI
ncbi:hypothetical protein PR048_024645 [Dryococelus australis]|uniref:Uncharacterized protein n=1 Tax=Dryococelus australis TaxID=614101 RepID=A0ABQ9GP59_9NEOP|nr:hypothetical protein PR048_024645 [Dryococelus australis]